jgi:hypothetical protein
MVSPIYKGCSRAKPSQYRPVSLTPHTTKTFERVVRDAITNYLESNNKLNNFQHGFRKGRSTLTELLDHTDFIMENIQTRNVDVIYLDFEKAFDKVDHGILLHKIRDLGITGKVGRWLGHFLTNRSQNIAANGEISTNSSVKSGVPQGTVLGPLLFLIMINDMNSVVKECRVASFADDTRLSKVITDKSDCLKLQEDTQGIFGWCESENMMLNSKKFECIKYGKDDACKEFTYTTPDGTEITSKNHVLDLGIILQNDLSYKSHIDNVVEKAKNLTSWILRTFESRERNVMLTLFKSLILPKIEYGSQLYFPYKITEISSIENIQRHFTRQIHGYSHLNYYDRLTKLKLFSLQRRAERYLIIYIWKVIEDKVLNLETNPITVKLNPRTGRKIDIPAVTKKTGSYQTIQYNSFIHRAGRIFNNLPVEVRNVTDVTVESFKTRLDRVLKTIKDQPPVPGYVSGCRNTLEDMSRWEQVSGRAVD